MELKEKALELAEYLMDENIIHFDDFEILANEDFNKIVLKIKQQLQEKYPNTKLKRQMKCVHYANGFSDESLKQSAFILDDIEQYLFLNKFINHDAFVRYFNELITTNGFEINPQNLVMTLINSLLISL